MKLIYPAIFYKDKEGEGYSIIFPDINTGATCGDNVSDGYYMAEDFLGCSLYDDYIDGKELPKATKFEDVTIEDDGFSDMDLSFKTMVDIDMDDYIRRTSSKTVKKTVTIPSYLNEMAKASDINFSKVLTEGLKKELNIKQNLFFRLTARFMRAFLFKLFDECGAIMGNR